jgi:hypothetical protein
MREKGIRYSERIIGDCQQGRNDHKDDANLVPKMEKRNDLQGAHSQRSIFRLMA